MKRILLILAIVLAMIFTLPLAAFAEETVEVVGTEAAITEPPTLEETAPIVPEEAPSASQEPLDEEAPTSDAPTEETASHTLLSRVWEYCNENRAEMLGLGGDALIFVLALFIKIKNDKKMKLAAADLKIIKGDASGTALSQSSVVGAVNGMIDGYNSMKTAYEKYEGTEEDRNKLVGAVMVQNTAILEILSAVYVNNRNLPQGTKDLVNLRYARCLEALGNDEALAAIVESVREKLNGVEAEESTEVATEAAETEE